MITYISLAIATVFFLLIVFYLHYKYKNKEKIKAEIKKTNIYLKTAIYNLQKKLEFVKANIKDNKEVINEPIIMLELKKFKIFYNNNYHKIKNEKFKTFYNNNYFKIENEELISLLDELYFNILILEKANEYLNTFIKDKSQHIYNNQTGTIDSYDYKMLTKLLNKITIETSYENYIDITLKSI